MTTFIVTFILILIAISLLGIGVLVKGKSCLKLGSCGKDPNKSRDDNCGNEISCSLCKKKKDVQQK